MPAGRCRASHQQPAHAAILDALSSDKGESHDDAILLEVMRLDRLHTALWPRAVKGDLGALDRIMRLSERRLALTERLNPKVPPPLLDGPLSESWQRDREHSTWEVTMTSDLTPPAHLSSDAREAWAEVTAASGPTLSPADAPVLEEYAQAIATARAARARVDTIIGWTIITAITTLIVSGTAAAITMMWKAVL